MSGIRTAALIAGMTLLLASGAHAARVGADGGEDVPAAVRALREAGATPFVFRPGADLDAPTIRPRPPVLAPHDAPSDGPHAGWFLAAPGAVAEDTLADLRLDAGGRPEPAPDPGRIPVSTVPEPAAIALFAAGAALLLARRRRSRKAGRS